MDEFEYPDIVLLASGCKVFRRTSLVHTLNMTMLGLVVICYLTTVYESIESTLESGGLVLLAMMERYSDELCGLLFIAVLTYNRIPMHHILLSPETSDLKPGQRAALKKHAAYSLLLVFLTMVQEAGFTTYYLMTSGRRYSLRHTALKWLECYHNMNSWFFGGCAVYTFFVKMIQFYEINYFDVITGRSDILTPDMDARLALERRAVAYVKKTLLKVFAFIPCLWIVHIFVKAPVVVMEVSQPGAHLVTNIGRTLPLLYEFLAVGYVVYQCECCNLVVGKRVSDLLMSMMESNRIGHMSYFVRQLEKSTDEGFSSWGTVAMDRKFFLGLLCSVVSCTVLFFQLTKKATGTSDIPVLPVVAKTLFSDFPDPAFNLSSSSFENTTEPALVRQLGW